MVSAVVIAAILLFPPVWWALLKARVVPRRLMQVWFMFTVAVVAIMCNLITLVIDLLRRGKILSRQTSGNLCSVACCFFFWQTFVWNPQICVVADEESVVKWKDIPHHSAVLINHTSFFDAFIFVGLAPFCYIYNTRTLMKDALRKLPVFGAVFDRVGQFPVFFKAEEEGVFSVDKERQAAVMARVNEHLKNNNRIALFPEGQVNKKPNQLLTFRNGSFATIIEHKLEVYYFVCVGNHKVWPVTGLPLGGPVDIVYSVGKVEVDYDTMDAPALARLTQGQMQKEVDRCWKRLGLTPVGIEALSAAATDAKAAAVQAVELAAKTAETAKAAAVAAASGKNSSPPTSPKTPQNKKSK